MLKHTLHGLLGIWSIFVSYAYDPWKIARQMGIDYLLLGIIGQGMGVLLISVGWWEGSGGTPVVVGNLLLVLATGVLVGGCGIYVRYHGFSRAWGLLGLLSVVGVIFVLILPMRNLKKRREGFSVIFAEPYRRDVWRMDVRVTLDGSLQTGVSEPINLQIPRGSNVGTAMKFLAGVIPGLNEGEIPARFLVNGKPVDRRTELSGGDSLVVFAERPVGGMNATLNTQRSTLNVE